MVEQGSARVRVVVVDDHELVRESVLRVLVGEPDLHPVGFAATLREAVTVVTHTRPDVVLLDQVLPDGPGAHAVAGLLVRHPAAAVVMLTGGATDAILRTAVAGGAAGLVAKTAGLEALLDAVRAAAAGDVALDGERLGRLLRQPHSSRPRTPLELDAWDREALVLLASGLRSTDLAVRRGQPVADVRRAMATLRAALGARSTLEALVLASRAGLLAT